jgi:hypothetical protein
MNLSEWRAKGHNTRSLEQAYPQIAEAFNLYQFCRSQSIVTYEKSKGKDTVQMIVPFPTGFSSLPEAGGIADQSQWLMSLFELFLVAERNAFYSK